MTQFIDVGDNHSTIHDIFPDCTVGESQYSSLKASDFNDCTWMHLVDRSQKAITVDEWFKLMGSAIYRTVKIDVVGDCTVITRWTGIVAAFSPLFVTIVETTSLKLVKKTKIVKKYDNQELALEGHNKVVYSLIKKAAKAMTAHSTISS